VSYTIKSIFQCWFRCGCFTMLN